MCIYVQEPLPEISGELGMHQRGPCVTLNICMFHGWLLPSLKLLLGKAFALLSVVCAGFLSPAVGGICLPLSTLFLSPKPLFVIFPPPQIPGSQYCLKLTSLRLVLHFSYLENCADSISSDEGNGHRAKATPNALETKPQQPQPGKSTSHTALRDQASQGFQIAGVRQL